MYNSLTFEQLREKLLSFENELDKLKAHINTLKISMLGLEEEFFKDEVLKKLKATCELQQATISSLNKQILDLESVKFLLNNEEDLRRG